MTENLSPAGCPRKPRSVGDSNWWKWWGEDDPRPECGVSGGEKAILPLWSRFRHTPPAPITPHRLIPHAEDEGHLPALP